MKVLELYDVTAQVALDRLGSYKSVYEDGEGSAWLPKESIPETMMEQIVSEGLGRIVSVDTWSDDEVATYLNASDFIIKESPLTSDDSDLVEALAFGRVCTHYGRIGTESSLWVVSSDLPYTSNDPQERIKLWQLGMLLGVDISNEEPAP